jgi:hypothetical protein
MVICGNSGSMGAILFVSEKNFAPKVFPLTNVPLEIKCSQ